MSGREGQIGRESSYQHETNTIRDVDGSLDVEEPVLIDSVPAAERTHPTLTAGITIALITCMGLPFMPIPLAEYLR